MIAARAPVQRPQDARLLVVDARGRITHAPRSRFIDFLRPGDLVIANDAATLPASLHGVHAPSGAEIEVRLAGMPSLVGTASKAVPYTTNRRSRDQPRHGGGRRIDQGVTPHEPTQRESPGAVANT